tara:strand:+ start:198 stop:704 length:507 start_codon:yes stop_codon:yes gene_type:complete
MRPLKSFLPTPGQLREIKSIAWLGHFLFDPRLWHTARKPVSHGVWIGSLCCFLPIPFQMVPGALLCFLLRANVPVAIAIIWISNPVTMPVMFYFAYRVGALLLGTPEIPLEMELSALWLGDQLLRIWQPLLLGSLVCGATMGLTLFSAVRLYWRMRIVRHWRTRHSVA